MYHIIEEQERHPENYFLKEMDTGVTEDECFDMLSLPRQTQKTIGLYMKKLKNAKEFFPGEENYECKKKRFPFKPDTDSLEKEVERNKGFWIDRPIDIAPLTYKIKELYPLNTERKTKREQGIFYRPKTLELDHLKEMAKAGLLYPEEEFSDEEEEIKPDDSPCVPLRKVKYKICDPCKYKKKKKPPELKTPENLIEEMLRKGVQPPFRKIPVGCQCDYFGAHNKSPTVWDNPYYDRLDMLRQHEMNKVLIPYKHELLNNHYEKNPPVKFMAHEPGMKRTFPIYQISNL